VPEPKVAKNRVHLDIKVARGLSDDARRARIEAETPREGYWVVMHDVEGNEFCDI
jgi:hypothetical protein